MITHRASESVHCTTSAVNGLSRLTTTSNGQTSLSNRIESERPIGIRIESRSFAGPYCIRPYLNSKTASTISTSIVHSKLDYCNFPHNNLPKSHITRLQQVQNITERFHDTRQVAALTVACSTKTISSTTKLMTYRHRVPAKCA